MGSALRIWVSALLVLGEGPEEVEEVPEQTDQIQEQFEPCECSGLHAMNVMHDVAGIIENPAGEHQGAKRGVGLGGAPASVIVNESFNSKRRIKRRGACNARSIRKAAPRTRQKIRI